MKTMHKNKMVLHINNSSNNRTLLITVPYDINFEIKVDGKRVSYRKIFDTFIGCDLQPGIHEIELLYKNRGGRLYLGIIISCLSMMGAVRYLTIK